MSEKLSTATKLKMIGTAVAFSLTSCTTPPTPETRPAQGTVSAICPDTTDPNHQRVLELVFRKLPTNNQKTVRVEYDIHAYSGNSSTVVNPGQRLKIPGFVPTEGVDLPIPFALVTDATGAQTIATVNLSQCVTSDSGTFSNFFNGVTPDQIKPGQQASFNGKPWAFGKEAQARKQAMSNPFKGRVGVYGKAGPIYKRA